MPPKAAFRPGAAVSTQQHTAFAAPVVASSFEVVDSSDIALQLNALNIPGKVTGEAVGVVQQLLDMLAETSLSSNDLKGTMDELRSEVKQSRAEVEPLRSLADGKGHGILDRRIEGQNWGARGSACRNAPGCCRQAQFS